MKRLLLLLSIAAAFAGISDGATAATTGSISGYITAAADT